ncbi:hypothetical protein PhCBS80983_g04203 [Powellomyces hirtus]|uniref:NADH dehydrogenase [ubiquinone] 1 alpha subcomplex subunit n=1 Tax=Powellomyces hirtus TaxID=109895 RepID=A0A507E0K7_9FUNG|nr:hypothetical protein PhCBS80983_g04203 [Powellomyces hirtus]
MLRGLINAWKASNLPWRRHRIVGRDLTGNMYFEGPPMRAGTDRTRRTIEYCDGRDELHHYDPDRIPPQWQMWLRHTREAAPTIQELQQAEAQRLLTISRARELDRKWEERKLELERERLASLGSGSAKSAEGTATPPPPPPPVAEPQAPPQTAPSGQGDTFEPGAWKPAPRRR